MTVAASLGLFVPALCGALLVDKSPAASIRIGVTVGLVVVACGGLLAAFGWSGALLVAVVAGTCPVVRVLGGVWLRRGDRFHGAVAAEDHRLGDDREGRSASGGHPDGSVVTLVPLPDIPHAHGVPALD